MAVTSALITGAGAGIGEGLAVELGRRGVALTLADINYAAAVTVADKVVRAGGRAQAVACDVADESQQRAAFDQHLQAYGTLTYALLNAGIMETGQLVSLSGGDNWRTTLQVNLVAVMAGLRLAVRAMAGCGSEGTIMITASAGGLFPMAMAPVYSASKAGCIMLTRSLAQPLMLKHKIRICCLCPQFVDTNLVRGVAHQGEAVAEQLTAEIGGMKHLLRREQVVEAGLGLLDDASKVGTCLVVLAPGGDLVEPLRTRFQSVDFVGGSATSNDAVAQWRSWACDRIPAGCRKIVVRQLSTDFRAATAMAETPLPNPPPPGHVLLRIAYAGINASDINFTSGRYQTNKREAENSLPFDAGFETVGVVAAVGEGCPAWLLAGVPIAAMKYGGFAEYQVIPCQLCLPLPRPSPDMLALLTSGLTAAIALEQAGRMTTGETVLVTAAAGGTGQFAVQLAKAAGNHVIATCSSAAKAEVLRSLGADRVINYKEEDVKTVLRREYPKGVDLVYESVGGAMFKTCVDALAPKGRLIIIGAMSQYAGGWQPSTHVGLPEKLLMKSASITGFFLPLYAGHFRRHFQRLVRMVESGRLQVVLDAQPFVGLGAVAQAVDRLQSGKSTGKVVVQVARSVPGSPPAARL